MFGRSRNKKKTCNNIEIELLVDKVDPRRKSFRVKFECLDGELLFSEEGFRKFHDSISDALTEAGKIY